MTNTEQNAGNTPSTSSTLRSDFKRLGNKLLAFARQHPVLAGVFAVSTIATPFSPLGILGLGIGAATVIFKRDGGYAFLVGMGSLVGTLYFMEGDNLDRIRAQAQTKVLKQINSCTDIGNATVPYKADALTWKKTKYEMTMSGKVVECIGTPPGATFFTVEFDDGENKWKEPYYVAPSGYRNATPLQWDSRPK